MTFKSLLSVIIFTLGSAAFAQNTIQFGVIKIVPHSSSSDITGPFTPPGLSLDVGGASTLDFAYIRELSPHWNIELALGVPPKHEVALRVNNQALPAGIQGLNGQVVAQVKQLSPSLIANYSFRDKDSDWRPFVGLGVAHTRFNNATSSAVGDALNGGPTSVSLSSSTGLIAQLGMFYRINEKWSLRAAVATLKIKTTVTTDTQGVMRQANLEMRPIVSYLALGYSF
jgi:outer membrane protein